MGKKQRDLLHAGCIIKKIAPVLNMPVEKLINLFYEETFWNESTARHYFMDDLPWPFKKMGYDDCLEIVCDFLDKQQQEGKLTEQDVKEKQKKVKQILSVAFMDLDALTIHRETDSDSDAVEDRIENEIEWTLRDISKLDIDTLYVLIRYFDAFSSITECDLKWIDFLDCLGHIKELITIDEFKRKLLKERFDISAKLISENMSSKDFLQWLELLSRRGYKDTTRKADPQKLNVAIEKKIRFYADKCGFQIIPLHNFIRYLVDEHNGSFFNIGREYLKVFVLIKYWISPLENVPEISINIYPPQIEEERQP